MVVRMKRMCLHLMLIWHFSGFDTRNNFPKFVQFVPCIVKHLYKSALWKNIFWSSKNLDTTRSDQYCVFPLRRPRPVHRHRCPLILENHHARRSLRQYWFYSKCHTRQHFTLLIVGYNIEYFEVIKTLNKTNFIGILNIVFWHLHKESD